MKGLLFVFCVLMLVACRKDSPKPPAAAVLSFPLQNSECTTGMDLDGTTSQVEFKWQQADNAQKYELRVTHLIKGTTQTLSTETLSAKLPLEKGAPYSWVIITRNSETQESVTSAKWFFYNAGTRITHAPFPAQSVAPQSGSTVSGDLNNEVRLEWTGADVDNDIAGYDIYFATEMPPLDQATSGPIINTSLNVTVSSNSLYYWRITTRDREGNTSDSGIFSFRVN